MTVHELNDLAHGLSLLGGVIGGLAALLWLGRKIILLDRALTQLSGLANRELSHNGGHSTKDYAERAYKRADKTGQRVKVLEQKLNAHLEAHATLQPPQVTVTTGATDA